MVADKARRELAAALVAEVFAGRWAAASSANPAVERLELVASAAATAIAADPLQRLAELSRLPPPTATSLGTDSLPRHRRRAGAAPWDRC